MREAWRRFERPRVRTLARAGVVLLFAIALLGALRADRATLDVVRASCGKGRWSDAITRLAPTLVDKGIQAVCLDWGLGAQMRFTTPAASIAEPVWTLRTAPSAEMRGDHHQIYLMFRHDLSVYPYGDALLAAIASLPPNAVYLQDHVDRDGDNAFLSLRFAGPHRLSYRDGKFEVELR